MEFGETLLDGAVDVFFGERLRGRGEDGDFVDLGFKTIFETLYVGDEGRENDFVFQMRRDDDCVDGFDGIRHLGNPLGGDEGSGLDVVETAVEK